MADNFLRHMVGICAALICAFAFYAGYMAGQYHWWWAGASVIVVYYGVYTLVDK